MISVKNALSSALLEASGKPTRDEVKDFILKQTGVSLEACDQLKPSRRYYNFKLKDRASESGELDVILRFLPRQTLIKKVEPNVTDDRPVFGSARPPWNQSHKANLLLGLVLP